MTLDVSGAAERTGTSDLSGQVALVAGGGDESGTEIARQLSSRGATVALCNVDSKVLELLVGNMGAESGNAIAGTTERVQAMSNAVSRVRAQLGKIDILVNNASGADRFFPKLSVDEFHEALDATVTRSYELLHEAIPAMREKRYGRIINIYGLSYLGWPIQPPLAASYAAMFGLTRSLALETAVDGITVNGVVKGDIAATGLPAADAEKLASEIPVRRMGTAADVAYAVTFFASPSAKYVTGQTLFVCGGKSAYFSMSV